MKKTVASLSALSGYLLAKGTAFAQTTDISITRPQIGGRDVGFADINVFLRNAITLVFIVALVAVFVMLVWGAVEWIFSGGNKEQVGSARGRIVAALVGFAILAMAFALLQLAAGFLGFPSLVALPIPTP